MKYTERNADGEKRKDEKRKRINGKNLQSCKIEREKET